MKDIALIAGFALAMAAPAFAQDAPQNPPIATQPTAGSQQANANQAGTFHSTTVYHGPHRYPLRERGHRPGDPPIIDHSADTLVVEPTHSTITIMVPTVPPRP